MTIPFARRTRTDGTPLGPEDCRICGANRSACMDTDCPGDADPKAPTVPFAQEHPANGTPAQSHDGTVAQSHATIPAHERLEQRLTADGWKPDQRRGGGHRYRVWRHPAAPAYTVLVPADPTAGDYDELAARAEATRRHTRRLTATKEYGIERLIPTWSTNPDFPPGQPFADSYVEFGRPTREAAVKLAEANGFAYYRVMVREVTAWEPADD